MLKPKICHGNAPLTPKELSQIPGDRINMLGEYQKAYEVARLQIFTLLSAIMSVYLKLIANSTNQLKSHAKTPRR